MVQQKGLIWDGGHWNRNNWINEMFKEDSKQDGVMDWTQNRNGKNNRRTITPRFLSSKTRRILVPSTWTNKPGRG